MKNPVDLLVVAAHPDDAELAIGGTLAMAKRFGHRTGVVDLSRGELSSRGDLAARARETEEATHILNLDERLNLGLPDGGIRDTDEARGLLVSAIRRLRPQVVLAPWKEDLHPDHAGAGELAARSWYLCGVGKFAPGEDPYRPPALGYYMCHTPFEVTTVVDVSPVWELKLRAVKAYGSQFHQEGVEGPKTKISHPTFLQALEGRARDYGMLIGVEHGEPLRWELPPGIQDPVGFISGRAS